MKLSYQFNIIFLDGKELFFKIFIQVSDSSIVVVWQLILPIYFAIPTSFGIAFATIEIFLLKSSSSE